MISSYLSLLEYELKIHQLLYSLSKCATADIYEKGNRVHHHKFTLMYLLEHRQDSTIVNGKLESHLVSDRKPHRVNKILFPKVFTTKVQG